MIINLDWQIFMTRFTSQNSIYVIEEETRWVMYTQDGVIIIKAIKDKEEDQTRNIMFVDKYLNAANVIKVKEVDEQMIINNYVNSTEVMADIPMEDLDEEDEIEQKDGDN